jgi:hypothetical protein
LEPFQGSLPYLDEAFRAKEYNVSLDDLKELDWLLQPHILALCRFLLPDGHLSYKKKYWICPKGSLHKGVGGFKINLRTGALFQMGTGRIVPGYNVITLWMVSGWSAGNRSLRGGVIDLLEWIKEQEKVPKKEEPLFHADPIFLEEMFYKIMFGYGALDLREYRGTQMGMWKDFQSIWGPERTNDTPDFRSSYRMGRFLKKWCLGNDPQDFSVTLEYDSKTKTDVYVVTNNWYQPSPMMKKRPGGESPSGSDGAL